MKKLRILLVALLLALTPCCALAREIVEPGEDFYYLDEANVLSEATEGEIFFCNQLLSEECGAQIVVVALRDIGGADIYEYAMELGNEWGIGSGEAQNGFLLLMTIDEEDYYALAGPELARIFPASTLNRMYEDELEEDFAAGRYDAGARKFFEAVFERVADFYNLSLTPSDGIAAYEEYVSEDTASRNGPAPEYDYEFNYDYDFPPNHAGFASEARGPSLFSIIVGLIVILMLLRLLGRFMRVREGGFWSRHPFLTGLFLGSLNRRGHRPYGAPPPPPHPPRPPRAGRTYSQPRPPRPPMRGGGFGGSGRSGGGFGGARGGGGGGFRGGAGRGRH